MKFKKEFLQDRPRDTQVSTEIIDALTDSVTALVRGYRQS